MIFNITVGPKPINHPFYNRGSKYCFYINGIAGGNLELTVGQKYTFNINAIGHPFYLTTSENGGSEDNNMIGNFTPIEKEQLTYTVPTNLPAKFYYQCKIHQYMGSSISVISHNTFYIKPILRDLVAPTSLSCDSRNPSIIYIADQIGLIYKYDLNTLIVSIFLDIRQYIPQLNPSYEERGLLGLCFHPQFSQNGRFFIFYSSNREYDERSNYSYYNCLSEFVFQNGHILYEAEKVILRIPRDLNYHNGGKIGFGPDGFLYIAIGDGGEQRDPNGHAQDLNLWLGKVLRIDVNNVETHPYYRIPSDNPFINVKGAKPEIWAYGFRNPWGLEFYNNSLIVTDAGFEHDTGQEEVNIVVKGGNYGWNIKEGTKIAPWINPTTIPRNLELIDPAFAYTTSDPNFTDSDVSTIIGGYIDKSGDYICGDYSGRLIRLRFTESMEVVETGSIGKWLRSFGKAGNQLYVLVSQQQGPSGNSGEVFALDIN